jgi:predicted nucleotidyltransferase
MKTAVDKETLIDEIIERIKTGYEPEKIILFGSYAKGTAGPDSDVDLLIVKETDDRRIDRWVEVKRILRGLTSRIPISPLVYTPAELEERVVIKDYFILEVLEEGKVVYG